RFVRELNRRPIAARPLSNWAAQAWPPRPMAASLCPVEPLYSACLPPSRRPEVRGPVRRGMARNSGKCRIGLRKSRQRPLVEATGSSFLGGDEENSFQTLSDLAA